MTKAAVTSNVVHVDFKAKKLTTHKTAEDWYQDGCRLDENPATYHEATTCYEASLLLDPNHTGSRVNLGNVYYRAGFTLKATKLYRQALKLDRFHPEANYNYGFMLLETGKAKLAIRYFLYAIEGMPDFADAYFNLAMAYKQLGKEKQAKDTFCAYLRLDSDSEWSDRARTYLQELGVGVLSGV